MVESVGKKLHQARLQRGLTIDEAAHATKLRPDKIAALENDDYSRFANNIYAKGFLQIYGRFLKVDVEEFARTLDNANPISISDYQYLSNAPATKSETIVTRREDRRAPSMAPLFFFLVLVAVGAVAFSWVYKNYERIKGQPNTKLADAAETTPAPTPNADAAFVTDPQSASATPWPKAITPLPAAAGSPPALHLATATPGPAVPTLSIGATPRPTNTSALLPGGTPAPKHPEQDFVTPSPVTTTDSATHPNGMNEVLVAAVKKTWVTVRKDDPKAPPIFEDYVYPNANPLKLKGSRFFIEARDPAALQITKNGLPIAYQPTGVPVQ
jgi:cytoskeletal protein RodZ